MPNIQERVIKSVQGIVTKISSEDVTTVHGTVIRNYEADPVSALSRRKGSQRAVLYDHLGDVMDGTWWSAQWGARDVDMLLPLPNWPPVMPIPYDPGDRRPGARLMFGGGGQVADGGGTALAAVPRPALSRYFTVAIPTSISNGNAFNATVTAYLPDGTVDAAFTGPVTVVLSEWGTGGIDKTFTQVTAPAAVVWVAGVATISCRVDANARQLTSMTGCWMRVKAIYGADGRGPISGESNRGWLTAAGYFTVAVSASPVNVDAAFTLTVTAYQADGTADTSYAAAVTVSEASALLTLQRATGAAFSGFAAGDFTAGVASASLRLHAASLAVAEVVTISAVETGDTTPSGQANITVNATVSSYDAVTVSGFCWVDQDNPAVNHNGHFNIRSAGYIASAAVQRIDGFLKFSSPLTSFLDGYMYDQALAAILSLRSTAAHGGVIIGRIYVDFVLSDFTPATLTWTAAALLSYQTALGNAGDTENVCQFTTAAMGAAPLYQSIYSQLRLPRFAAIQALGGTCYGLRFRAEYSTGDWSGADVTQLWEGMLYEDHVVPTNWKFRGKV